MSGKNPQIIDKIFEKAQKLAKTVVLAEGDDLRTVQAARLATDARIAQVILVDENRKVRQLAKDNAISLSDIEVIVPAEYKEIDVLAQGLFERRKAKGMTAAEAATLVRTHLYFADMLVGSGNADGCVAGAVNSTGNVVKAALYCIGTKEKTASSFFLMLVPNFKEGEAYTPFVFADCGLLPFPTIEQLADIAIASSDSYKRLVGEDAKVAMLTYSTKGSAKHENIDKVLQSMNIVKQKRPDITIDGEFQLDAAVIPSIGKRKAPDSAMAGFANTLIFPDLNAGNICYKATERFAKAIALGPILQGFNKPVNDLSRGCSADDIFKIIAITAVNS
ncbi:MAG: phosphate acetyltransferase [Candidatus Raymondbacteria bacterium RifOxyA12_full_50_37]|uniref:Phosphate acetyltransferase n=1 Tax=Candidatus Raymondbacteria bacterium RIFOXYD12_FULL_49_13 TaxID=1817890 RepID=A0A1F7F430_UNCRA|nr:MAG: phosphate acetyltransferase [Candidatus Raymondbacteria bacterium RifOxyA12_full_50_37]OGJ93844.1 MAG: phosphate acetyltransferase [Candidatus Raymondbacteria bacterium RIFOXYA2_FULL_49_16]OGJ97320.1 MAG: phosphate acetyltransferase [Candidatus Raymondbacteria bacterium RifOxyC12_full_50_8]OGJ98289.1 MAG: phosphate acetyltransferase [Candidatus Raymondbacteria bacterium RIFOXYC2_FULL_50_21]OGK01409.1 MAG: phosphate acetyltransferase [Candidatus Raymondbacteria bacterium RIFOXYD12_FULL_4